MGNRTIPDLRDEVLLLQEVALHPSSVLTRLEQQFEKPSIIHIFKRDQLRSYNKPPIYDIKYLVIFDDLKVFTLSIGYLHLDFMIPVVVCTTRSMTDEARDICRDKHIPFRIYVNKFEKDDAYRLIMDLASEQLSMSFCEALVRRVGLSPQRIISAIMVCEQVGYKTANISRYIDKYIYIDIYDVIESLLGICRSGAQIKRAALYLHMNRLWYRRFTQNLLVAEVDFLIQVYRDLIEGNLTSYHMRDYIEREHLPRYKVLYAVNLFEQISLNELLVLRKFLSSATLLEVSMHLM